MSAHALTMLEERANAHRVRIYAVALWIFVGIACLVAMTVWTTLVFDEGVRVGRGMEKQKQADTVKPTTSCANLAQVCAAEQAARWRRK